MAAVLPFPRRRRRAVATPLFPAEVRPFPLSRNVTLVERAADVMRAMSDHQAGKYLIRQLEYEQEVMQGHGIDQQLIDRSLLDLCDAVHAKLWTDADSQPGGAA